eukprot:244080_1
MRNVKCVLVGDPCEIYGGNNKTLLLISYTTNSFPTEYIPTVFDNYSANVMVDGKPIQLGLWDTKGQEEYDRLRPLSYLQTDVFMVCYAIWSRTAYENCKSKWVPEIKHHAPEAAFILVGTCIELRGKKEYLYTDETIRIDDCLTYDDGVRLAEETGARMYVECSALTQEGLKNVFDQAIRAALTKKNNKPRKRSRGISFGLFNSTRKHKNNFINRDTDKDNIPLPRARSRSAPNPKRMKQTSWPNKSRFDIDILVLKLGNGLIAGNESVVDIEYFQCDEKGNKLQDEDVYRQIVGNYSNNVCTGLQNAIVKIPEGSHVRVFVPSNLTDMHVIEGDDMFYDLKVHAIISEDGKSANIDNTNLKYVSYFNYKSICKYVIMIFLVCSGISTAIICVGHWRNIIQMPLMWFYITLSYVAVFVIISFIVCCFFACYLSFDGIPRVECCVANLLQIQKEFKFKKKSKYYTKISELIINKKIEKRKLI